ncbi:hypothetical protein J40TS1_26150 [Paenibacillus montaniterrae]|uniref:Uncharacterized protein n=1 Tax=Paenibacillus montaniterrae TaxID=429341 RepID=A0A920CZ15_9BACL|nr:hypothetical protein J40TS1_26150 [Paenibacillus montaniterrae]
MTERSVDKDYVSTYNVSAGNILRKHHLSAEPIFDADKATCDYIGIKVGLFELPLKKFYAR